MNHNEYRERDDLFTSIIRNNDTVWWALNTLKSVGLSNHYIGGGLIRSAVWDHKHGYDRSYFHARPRVRNKKPDIDVVSFSHHNKAKQIDRHLSDMLNAVGPSYEWEVVNQSYAYTFNNHAEPFTSLHDAASKWPETATCVCVRIGEFGKLDIIAPYGLGDLMNLIIRPSPHFVDSRLNVVLNRIRDKHWIERWPDLKIDLSECNRLQFTPE